MKKLFKKTVTIKKGMVIKMNIIIKRFLFLIPLIFVLTCFTLLANNIPAHANENMDESSTQSIKNMNPIISTDTYKKIEPNSYWTEEKMKNAIPVKSSDDLQSPLKNNENNDTGDNNEGIISHPYSPDDFGLNPNAVVPSTSGKVFYSYNGKDYVCSGSAINNPYKNLVMTAAHCVHDGPGGGWHSNIAFAPAYYDGVSSYGLWEWDTARTFNGWINNRNYDYDQAFFTVRQKNGKNLVNVVGGNGLSYNYNQAQPNVRISGYPAESPYNGRFPYSCYGDTKKRQINNDAYMNCDFTGGASGGPWLRDMINENVGYVFAVTSRRSTSGTPRLYAHPNTQAVKDMFDKMD